MKLKLRELHRLEWENIVISLINSGWGKSDAQHEADERIRDRWEDIENSITDEDELN